MRILPLGENGQVGWELLRTLAPLGEVVAMGRAEADLSRPEQLRSVVRNVHPRVIVNAAAYTDVDRAESEPELAMAVNGNAPGILAEEAERNGAGLVHYSTDYVFDGEKREPYVETDLPNPINVYGRTKWAGEEAIRAVGGAYLILRTSWVYSLRGGGFVTRVLRLAREKDELRVVEDQVGSPTWARMLAEVTAHVIARGHGYLDDRGGTYHLAGRGSASRLQWAKAILKVDPRRMEQVVKHVGPAGAQEFPSIARRPCFSALDSGCFEAAFGLGLPGWEASLGLAMADPSASV